MKARIMAMVLGATAMASMWEAIPPSAQAGDQNRGSARAVGGSGGDASAAGGVAIGAGGQATARGGSSTAVGGRGGDAKPGNPSTATNDCHAKQGRAGRATAGEA